MWDIDFKVSKKKWMDHPEERWDQGLQRAGFNFRQLLQRSHYPPLHTVEESAYAAVSRAFGGTYHSSIKRTGRTYATADKAGFRVTEPGRVMEFGSTFYLPFILDGTSKWVGWPGKKDELEEGMRQGFASGIRDYTE